MRLRGSSSATASNAVKEGRSRVLSTAFLWLLASATSTHTVSNSTDNQNSITPRIINGDSASASSAVSFFARPARDDLHYTSDPVCGATLIHSDILVTAAHCFGAFHYGALLYDATSKKFSRNISINRQVRHPEWDYYGNSIDAGKLNFDVMLLRLETPIPQDDSVVRPISFNHDSTVPKMDDSLTIYGFGKTEAGGISNELRQAIVQYIDNSNCTDRFQQNGIFMQSTLPSEFMCTIAPSTIDVSTCNGDSGGPVTMQQAAAETDENQVLVGVISAGIGCSTATFPNGHARISKVSEWIQEQICRLSYNPPTDCVQNHSTSSTTVPLQLSFSFDFFPQETLYAIRSLGDQRLVYTGPEMIAQRNQQVNTTIYLLPGLYAMEVYDTFGNGMMGRTGTPADPSVGEWELIALPNNDTTYGGTLLARGYGNFTQNQITPFEIMSPTNGTIFEEVNLTISECLVLQGDRSESPRLYTNPHITCECLPSLSVYNLSPLYRLVCHENATASFCAKNFEVCRSTAECCGGLACINDVCFGHSSTNRIKEESKIGGEKLGQNGHSRAGGLRRTLKEASSPH